MTEQPEDDLQMEKAQQPEPVDSAHNARAQEYGLTDEQAEMLSLYL